jgi:hypothetical protein
MIGMNINAYRAVPMTCDLVAESEWRPSQPRSPEQTEVVDDMPEFEHVGHAEGARKAEEAARAPIPQPVLPSAEQHRQWFKCKYSG